MTHLQIPSIVLPAAMPVGGYVGTEQEAVADLLTHVSAEALVEFMQDKLVHVVATEVVAAGVPGPLWLWVELSPYPTAVSAAYWAAIGGGGGTLPPTAPTIIAGTGVNGTVHTVLMPWTIYSLYARLVAQTPVAAGLPGASWSVQATLVGKG